MKMKLLSAICVSLTIIVCESASNSRNVNAHLTHAKLKQEILVRKRASDLSASEVDSLRRGFRVMMSRPSSDPTSYSYQIWLHGWDFENYPETSEELAVEKNWWRSQHGTWWFLPWHRMFLYTFERLLRRAADDPTLTLPYWDYYNYRQIPEAYRLPADEELNSLYIRQRCEDLNNGTAMFPSEAVDHMPALREVEYISPPEGGSGFAGGRSDAPIFIGPSGGVLESVPHGPIHITVAGPDGFMSDIFNSPTDPTFFLHHMEIDRIWETWLRLPNRSNPTDEVFLNQTFEFFDEEGQRVSMAVRDVMDMRSQLNVDYATLAEIPRALNLKSRTLIGSVSPSNNKTGNRFTISLNKEAISKMSRSKENHEYHFRLNASVPTSRIRYELYLSNPVTGEEYLRLASFAVFHTNGDSDQRFAINQDLTFSEEADNYFNNEFVWDDVSVLEVELVPTSCASFVTRDKLMINRVAVSILDLFASQYEH